MPDPERDRRRLRVLRSAMGRSARLRVDANNLFDKVAACTAHLEALQAPIWAIEEPLAARDFEGMCEVARERGLKIILDESAVLSGDLAGLSGADWIVNLRVSKLGGVIRSLDMLKMIRAQGLGAILGSHVGETSILARAGLTLAAACGADLQAAECGYGGYLLHRDLAHPQVRFNLRGILGADVSSQGLGIRVDRSFLVPVAS